MITMQNQSSELMIMVRGLAREDGLNLETLPVRDFMSHLGRWVRSGRLRVASDHLLAQVGATLSQRSPIDVLRAIEQAERQRASHYGTKMAGVGQQPLGGGGPQLGGDEDFPGVDETPSVPIGEQPLQDQPLVFAHGIMGSQLGQKVFRENGDVLKLDFFWPPSLVTGGSFASKVRKALSGLTLPPSSVGASGLFPGAYDSLISGIRLMGYRENVNFWIYAYDWRQSNRESGVGLFNLVETILEDHPEWADKGVDVVAHSMGCLVTAEAKRLGARINRDVLIAGPHYGAPLAFFVLNPKINVIDGFKAFILEAAWDAVFKQPGDSENFQRRLKEIARSFPSVYELLPDDYYFNELKQYIVEYFGKSGNRRGFIMNAEVTYKHSRCGIDADRARDTQGIYDTLIDNALAFKRPLTTLRGDPGKNLVIYSDSITNTPDVITFVREGSPEFREMRDSGQNGDGTVPTRSAKELRGAVNIQRVLGNHNEIANANRTIDLIRQHLGVD